MSVQPSCFSGPAAPLLGSILVALLACGCTPAAPDAKDKQALDIIERAKTAPASIAHAAIDLQLVELAVIAPGQPPLSATEEKLYATFARKSQPDGSMILSDRADGRFESLSPALTWLTFKRTGEEHVNIIFDDGENSYSFLAQSPDQISRRTIPAHEKVKGPSILGGMAKSLAEDSEQASFIRLRGPELIRGVLCDVIELSLPAGRQADGTEKDRKEAAYYVGVFDRLIYRTVERHGEPRRHRYKELALTIDPSFVPREISYGRFESEVKALLNGKPLPPAVATMQ